MVEQSLLHVTLNTNSRRRTPRSEASLEAIERLSVLIQKPEFEIPGQAAYRCDVFEPGGRRCSCFQVLDENEVSLVSFGVGLGVDCSQALWAALHARANFLNLKIKTQLERSPRPPWLGVLLEPGLLPGSPARKWLEDFARCLSWAVLDQVRSRASPGAGWVN